MEPSEGERTGATRAALANAIVALKKEHFGRGPTAAKAWVMDEYAFVVLEDGLTRQEETLLADGKEDVVREARLAFSETTSAVVRHTVEQVLDRPVLAYHSQVAFDPVRIFEVFVLAPEAA